MVALLALQMFALFFGSKLRVLRPWFAVFCPFLSCCCYVLCRLSGGLFLCYVSAVGALTCRQTDFVVAYELLLTSLPSTRWLLTFVLAVQLLPFVCSLLAYRLSVRSSSWRCAPPGRRESGAPWKTWRVTTQLRRTEPQTKRHTST